MTGQQRVSGGVGALGGRVWGVQVRGERGTFPGPLLRKLDSASLGRGPETCILMDSLRACTGRFGKCGFR